MSYQSHESKRMVKYIHCTCTSLLYRNQAYDYPEVLISKTQQVGELHGT